MGKIIRKIFAVFVAFFVAGGLGELLKLLGPAFAGWIIMAFDLTPNRALHIETIEAIGNIAAVLIMLYVGLKVYKRMTRVKKGKEE